MNDSYDFVVIGGGSAGYAGASMAARHGLETVVIEGAEEVGGLCILRGCMPSKTLLESSRRAESIRRAAEFGLRAEYRGADGPAIRARKRQLIGEFADYRRQQLENGPFTFLRGVAAFVDPQTVEVRLKEGGVQRISGRAFLLATGSHVKHVPVPGLKETGCWTSDEVLDAGHIPASVVVLGAGAIGLELASFYEGVGSRVTVIQRGGQVMKELDADLAHALTHAMERRGIRILLNTTLTRVERKGGSKCVHFQQQGSEHRVEAEEIIYALGRKPNVEGLALEKARIAGKGCVVASPTQQTNQPHIFAAGDVCSPIEVVHVAVQQGELAARNAARLLGRRAGELERMDYALKLFVGFTQPEVATVGLGENEAADAGQDFVVAKFPFSDHGKALVRGETEGFVKLIAERTTRRLIGGAVVGPEAAELIHEIVMAMRFGATAGQLATTPHYHPTLSEIWTYPAEALAES
ncbi:MAG: FAD-dependent oxidoreductase [Verrucomicrobiota bacterium]|nr:FAD-dependent oxidoreductase [Verrucomicrobiota bacterium]